MYVLLYAHSEYCICVILVFVHSYKRILVLISHSQDFLNGVCTNIVHMSKRRLKYFTGNYEAFVRTRMELLENQMKQYNWEQDQISHMKVTIFNQILIYSTTLVHKDFITLFVFLLFLSGVQIPIGAIYELNWFWCVYSV